ncbi:MAG: hypothetical protein GY950_06535 [bacterium]|nr:hypothetical protein [bacterium]
MKTKKIALILIVILMTVYLPGAEPAHRVYEEKEGQQLNTHRFTVETAASGYSIGLASEIKGVPVRQTFQLDSGLGTLSWSYENPKTKTKVTARRKGDKIYLSGTDDGDPVEKTFKVSDLPWNQTFNIGLEQFALSSQESMRFWAIGTSGPGNMKITKFKVKRKKIETITLRGEAVKAVYLTISLSGILSLFWTGNYWYRKSDGRFLRYRGKNRRGGPIAVMELVSESEI